MEHPDQLYQKRNGELVGRHLVRCALKYTNAQLLSQINNYRSVEQKAIPENTFTKRLSKACKLQASLEGLSKEEWRRVFDARRNKHQGTKVYGKSQPHVSDNSSKDQSARARNIPMLFRPGNSRDVELDDRIPFAQTEYPTQAPQSNNSSQISGMRFPYRYTISSAMCGRLYKLHMTIRSFLLNIAKLEVIGELMWTYEDSGETEESVDSHVIFCKKHGRGLLQVHGEKAVTDFVSWVPCVSHCIFLAQLVHTSTNFIGL